MQPGLIISSNSRGHRDAGQLQCLFREQDVRCFLADIPFWQLSQALREMGAFYCAVYASHVWPYSWFYRS